MLVSWISVTTCIKRLNRRDKTLLSISTLLQIALSILDIIGVALLGILGSIAIRSDQPSGLGERTSRFLEISHLDSLSVQNQAVILGVSAAFFLVTKTLLSMELTRRTFGYFGRRNADLTSEVLGKILNQPLSRIQLQSTQDILYFSTMGVSAMTIGVLGSLISIIADGALLIAMLVALALVSPGVALGSTVIFGLVFIALHFGMSSKMSKLGQSNYELNLAGNKTILSALDGYRELAVNSRIQSRVDKIRISRVQIGVVDARLNFLPNLSKYIFEITIVIAAFLVSASQFYYLDANQALSTLTVFMAASTRIAPAILRLQQSILRIKGSLPVAVKTFPYFDLPAPDEKFQFNKVLDLQHTGFVPSISIKSLSTKYPDQAKLVLSEINLEIEPGTHFALVGPSGAGKSTLVDAVLGIQPVTTGEVLVSGELASDAIEKWPGAVGYVPQEVLIIEGTIRENIEFGFPPKEISDADIFRVLDLVGLTPFVNSLDRGLDTNLGENGARISGGQKQRIGIARALIMRPKLLVLDEATSALDAESENQIEATIRQLSGQVTILVVAHRLSTVITADKVAYMEGGEILAEGKFEYVRSKVPNFDSQARLMGL
jgi:ABC-type multidrug transport system fused ATPase/permease subunit